MVEHINILKDIVENLVHTVEVNSVDNDVPNNTSTLDVCYTYYLNDNHERVTIDGIIYKVVSFIINEELVLTPKTPTDALVDVATTSFEIDPPKWYNGTERAVSIEMSHDQKKAGFKGPYIYLQEPFRIVGPEDQDESLVRSTMQNVNIHFLDNVRQADWDTGKHYEKVIYPQNNELDFVYRAFKKKGGIFGEDFNSPDVINLPDWGVEIANQGGQQTKLTERMSGVRGVFNIPFIVDPKTCCSGKTQKIVICKPVNVKLNGVEFGPVNSGGTLLIPVEDTLGDPQGAKVGAKWIVPAVTPTFRPKLMTGQQTIYYGLDDGQALADGLYGGAGIIDYWTLDPSNLNIHGTDKRFTGKDGGYIDPVDELIYDINGVLSDKATEFEGDRHYYDHYRRLKYYINRSGSLTWTAAMDFAENLVNPTNAEAGYRAWNLLEWEDMMTEDIRITSFLPLTIFNFGGLTMWSSTTYKKSTDRAMRVASGSGVATTAVKTQANPVAMVKAF